MYTHRHISLQEPRLCLVQKVLYMKESNIILLGYIQSNVEEEASYPMRTRGSFPGGGAGKAAEA
jgi:hypothetical protein